MAQSKNDQNFHLGDFAPSNGLTVLVYAMIALGAGGTIFSILQNPSRGWAGYLSAFFFVTCLAVEGLFFAAINNMSKAGWSVSIRRASEAMTAFIPYILIFGLLIGFGAKHLFLWMDPQFVASQPLVAAKTPYLNLPFMLVRIVIFALAMWGFQCLIVGNSVKQDEDGQESRTVRNVGLSVAFVLVFALTFSFFSVDLLMSLLPTWYSTIFGVYTFAGLFQSGLAFLILMLLYLKNMGWVEGYISIEHVHDVAKYLKGFTVFWAYIAFSQFMLIWYANIPEETEFFLIRAQNGWTMVSVLLIFGKFIVPFLALLPRAAKRTESHLVVVCLWVLFWQYVDIFWMVGPNFNDNQMIFGVHELAPLVGFVGLFLFFMGRFLKKHNLVAIRDPRLQEALHHHVTY